MASSRRPEAAARGPAGAPRAVVIAHIDSKSGTPGALDNATGVAAMLEVARLLADVTLRDTVQFVAFSGEEQGMWVVTVQQAHQQLVQVHAAEQSLTNQRRTSPCGLDVGQGLQL